MRYNLFASESVSNGHPDKICDQISDAVLDAALKQDQNSHTGIECLVTTNKLVISGEVKTKAKLDYQAIARKLIKKIGYNSPIYHFDYHTLDIEVLIHQQSPDIALGVDPGGAGDQGMMFGYAVNETPHLMPLPITLAHHLIKKLDQLKSKKLPYLRPDGKTQVVVSYEQGKPKAVENIVIAVPHDPEIKKTQLKNDLLKHLVTPVLERFKLPAFKKSCLIINGTGKWEIGGPHSDMGETGRKIIVDSYGGMARVGGGCFSGKCPTKVDRSAAYGARYVAKNIVKAQLADRCEVQSAYVIGQPQPVAYSIETFNTHKKSLKIIKDYALKLLDMSVPQILKTLDLKKPIYQKTAVYGHFGRPQFPWEKIAG